jgi:hypothetical protein
MHLILIDADLGELGMIGLNKPDPLIRYLFDKKGDDFIDNVLHMAERQVQILGFSKGKKAFQKFIEPIDLFGDPVQVFSPGVIERQFLTEGLRGGLDPGERVP